MSAGLFGPFEAACCNLTEVAEFEALEMVSR